MPKGEPVAAGLFVPGTTQIITLARPVDLMNKKKMDQRKIHPTKPNGNTNTQISPKSIIIIPNL